MSKHKLSERIDFFRLERPSEWLMDDLKQAAIGLEQRIAELEKEVKASVEEIRDLYLIISGQYSHRDALEADKAELLDRLIDMEKGDDAQAWKEARKVIAKHQQPPTGDSNDL
jgi:hypothetical protein